MKVRNSIDDGTESFDVRAAGGVIFGVNSLSPRS